MRDGGWEGGGKVDPPDIGYSGLVHQDKLVWTAGQLTINNGSR